jgi:hypothetical protein
VKEEAEVRNINPVEKAVNEALGCPRSCSQLHNKCVHEKVHGM